MVRRACVILIGAVLPHGPGMSAALGDGFDHVSNWASFDAGANKAEVCPAGYARAAFDRRCL
jgi:hypothetical protein